jgi:AraC-like DNA-binding protein
MLAPMDSPFPVDPSVGTLQAALTARRAGEAAVLRSLRAISEAGGNPDDALRSAGITVRARDLLQDGLAGLSGRALQSLSSWASVVAGNLEADRVGRAHFRSCDYRLLFYCLVGEQSLREAIERAQDAFDAVDGRLGSLRLGVEGDRAWLDMGRRQGPDDALGFVVALHGMCNYHNILEWLIGTALPAIGELDHAPHLADGIDTALLPLAVQLGRPAKRMSFPAAMLDRPVIRSIRDFHQMPSHNFLFATPGADTTGEIAERARRSLARSLRDEGSLCSLPRLAAMLQLSEATLRRRLAGAGTSFRDLRESVRRQLALELLQTTALPVEVISDRLDYCDSDAFRRAMREWTGQSPREYRRRFGGGAAPARVS